MSICLRHDMGRHYGYAFWLFCLFVFVCLFVRLDFFCPIKIFSLILKRQRYAWGLQIFTYMWEVIYCDTEHLFIVIIAERLAMELSLHVLPT